MKDKTVLFEIDRTQFGADLNKAKADVARAEADVKNWTAQTKLAEAEFTRIGELSKKGATRTDLPESPSRALLSRPTAAD